MIHSKEQLRAEIAKQLLRAKEDPLYYFSKVQTLDVDDKRIKPYPIHKKYLQNLVILSERERRLAVYKARQMVVTWTMCGVASREVLFFPGSYTAFISKKEEDAGKLCGRVKTIYENLPSYWKLALPEPVYYRAKKNVIVKIICHHPHGLPDSIIQAYPEGGDQLRSDSYSLIYWDECGFCDGDLFTATYAASVPALGKHGRLIMSSTPPRNPEHPWYLLTSGKWLA